MGVRKGSTKAKTAREKAVDVIDEDGTGNGGREPSIEFDRNAAGTELTEAALSRIIDKDETSRPAAPSGAETNPPREETQRNKVPGGMWDGESDYNTPVGHEKRQLPKTLKGEELAKKNVVEQENTNEETSFELNLDENEFSEPERARAEGAYGKGKGIDPGNWGASGLEEVDLETQKAAIESFETSKRKEYREGTAFTTSSQDSARIEELEKKLAEGQALIYTERETYKTRAEAEAKRMDFLEQALARLITEKEKSGSLAPSQTASKRGESKVSDPVSQLAPNSYLGKAFRRLTSQPLSETDSSDSSSDESGSENSSDEDNAPEPVDGKKVKCLIKPVPPKTYNGSANMKDFHQYMTDGTAYVIDGQVGKDRQVYILSHYLSGKARDFYVQEVSRKLKKWNLEKFFKGLFNHCFPADFKSQQRMVLNKTFQNEKTIRAYTFELKELFSVIGDIPKETKARHFFDGLRKEFQTDLIKSGYNKEFSTLHEMMKRCEITESALNLEKRYENRDIKGLSNRKPFPKKEGRWTGQSKPNTERERPGPSTEGENKKNPKSDPRREEKGNKRTYLSAADKSDYRAAGKCFKCGETGHVERQCRKSLSVKSNQKGKPPGLASNNIEIRLKAGGMGATTEGITFGMMDLNLDELGLLGTPVADALNQQRDFQQLTLQGLPVSIVFRQPAGTTDIVAMASIGIGCVDWNAVLELALDEIDKRNYPIFRNISVALGCEERIGDPMGDPTRTRIRDILEDHRKHRVTPWGAKHNPVYAERLKGRHVEVTDPDWNFSYVITKGETWNPEFNVLLNHLNVRRRQSHEFQMSIRNMIGVPRILKDRKSTEYRILIEVTDGTVVVRDMTQYLRATLVKGKYDRVSFPNIPKSGKTYEFLRRIQERLVDRQVTRDLLEYEKGQPMGNTLGRRVANILGANSPYTGDDANDARTMDPERFYSYTVKSEKGEGSDFVIVDCNDVHDPAFVPEEMVADPNFNIAAWYEAWARGADPDQTEEIEHDERMGDALVERLEIVLMDGYPGTTVTSLKTEESVVLETVIDNERFQRTLERKKLANTRFRPNVWWTRQINRYLSEMTRIAEANWDELTKEAEVLTELEEWKALWSDDVEAETDESEEEEVEEQEEDDDWDYSDVSPDSETDCESNHSGASESDADMSNRPILSALEVMGVQVKQGTYPGIQRNAAVTKDFVRKIPKPVIVVAKINGQPVKALIDSGSLSDFVSTTLVDQLKLKKNELEKQIPLYLAVQGSKSKISFGVTCAFEYQSVKTEKYFDVINLSNYDIVLGTPFLFQHKVTIGLNPTRVIVGSSIPQQIKGENVASLSSRAMDIQNQDIDRAREELLEYARPICKVAMNTPLPPLRAINHTIPLIDEEMIYPWRPSRCPEALRPQWDSKRIAYLDTGRWKMTSIGNTVPMLCVKKAGKPANDPQLRTLIDLRARNKNTRKMSSPLPDIEGILRRVAKRKFRSIIDGQDAYEQIRIVPEHVDRSAVTTPDRNMVSLVIQIGDCNAPATYQALMNYLFSAYIGVFMDVYLDDIIIYSDTLEDHVKHVKLILDILKREKLFLSEKKMHLLCAEMKILGRVVDDEGIKMDPSKVDSVVNWKVPTNRDLLRGFVGSVVYLAGDLPRIMIPLAVLNNVTGDTVPFRWGETEQRAFDEAKGIVASMKGQHRTPLDYGKGSPPVNIVTDGCLTGIAGVVSQGESFKTAKVAAYFSAKLNPAQQNYPVHEIEMLAGVETMLRHRDILQGTRFRWYTDHKGLIHLLEQKNLSGRQARWMEKISEFDFEVIYVPGVENVLSDALSRMYSNEARGTVRSRNEYTFHDDQNDNEGLTTHGITMPVLVADEAEAAGIQPRRSLRLKDVPPVSYAPEPRKRRTRRPAELISGSPEQGNETEAPEKVSEETEEAGDRSSSGSTKVVPTPTGEEILLTTLEGIVITDVIRGRYAEDAFFKDILDRPKEYKNFVQKDGLIFLKNEHSELLCLPWIIHGGRNVREIVIAEAHSLLAHLGPSKTLDFLRGRVWWKEMVKEVKLFCDLCVTCRRSKPSNQKPYGLLNPLSVPTRPWEKIGIDFVGPLPVSKNRDAEFDAITVVIDLLTAMVHLIPSRVNYTARQVAELVFEHIYKLHGLPSSIVSDRDVLFTSEFWNSLHRLLGSKLRMSSAYHPQSDGSTERANRTITQMIRQCIHKTQKDWVSKLPGIEFVINLTRSQSTGYAPFYLNNGRLPRTIIWETPDVSEYPGVRVFAQKLKMGIMQAHDEVIAARVKQVRNANRRRQPSPFEVDDLVYFTTKNLRIPKGLARKFIPKFVGPYRILESFANNSYRIELPREFRVRGVADVMHASKLRIHVPNDDRLFPGRLVSQVGEFEEQEPEWMVDRILSHTGSRENSTLEVRWKAGDVTWLPYSDVAHLNALVEYFETLGIERIGQLAEGGGEIPEPESGDELIEGDLEVNFIFPLAIYSDDVEWGFFHSNSTFTSPIPLPSRTITDSPSSYPLYHQPLIMSYKPTRFTNIFISPDRQSFVITNPTTGTRYSYTRAQFREYIQRDTTLRTAGFNPNDPIPGGYKEFRARWNRFAADSGFSFAGVNTDRSISASGPSMGRDVVLPEDPERAEHERTLKRQRELEEELRDLKKKTSRGDVLVDMVLEERVRKERFKERNRREFEERKAKQGRTSAFSGGAEIRARFDKARNDHRAAQLGANAHQSYQASGATTPITITSETTEPTTQVRTEPARQRKAKAMHSLIKSATTSAATTTPATPSAGADARAATANTKGVASTKQATGVEDDDARLQREIDELIKEGEELLKSPKAAATSGSGGGDGEDVEEDEIVDYEMDDETDEALVEGKGKAKAD